jgi:hypothetical protein
MTQDYLEYSPPRDRIFDFEPPAAVWPRPDRTNDAVEWSNPF